MKLVKENIKHFERGLNPKTAMGTGIILEIKRLLTEVSRYMSKYVDVTGVKVNKSEVLIDALLFNQKNTSIDNLNKKITALGLNQYLEDNITIVRLHHSAVYIGITLLYTFKPEFVGIFGKEDTLIESMNFQRGLEPKAAMGIGIESEIKKYAADHEMEDGSNEDILDHILNYDLGPEGSDNETKKQYIDWLLKHVQIEYIDENTIEALHSIEWNLVPYIKKYPGGNFTIKKTPTHYVVMTADWDNFVDYFQDENRFGKYIGAVLSGDAIEYFMYDYSGDYQDKLDVYDLEYTSPSEFGDIMEKLAKLKFPNKQKQLEFFQKSKTVGVMFEFIWEQADARQPGFIKLKNAIMKAVSETMEAGNEYAAFKDLTSQITDHFDMTLIKNSVDLKFKITEKGLNQLIYAHWLDDARIKYNERENYGDFDVETFHECFDAQINN